METRHARKRAREEPPSHVGSLALQRSAACATGYKGVRASGQNFRADFGKTLLGTFSTAVEAAVAVLLPRLVAATGATARARAHSARAPLRLAALRRAHQVVAPAALTAHDGPGRVARRAPVRGPIPELAGHSPSLRHRARNNSSIARRWLIAARVTPPTATLTATPGNARKMPTLPARSHSSRQCCSESRQYDSTGNTGQNRQMPYRY